ETENGRSISVISRVRPGKRKRAMAQAAATPNTRVAATAAGAPVSGNRMALRGSAPPARVSPETPMPRASALEETVTTGVIPRTVMTATASPISVQRTSQWSRWPWRGPAAGSVGFCSGSMAFAPPLQQVDQGQEHEGQCQQHDGDGRGLGVGELFQPRHD